MNPDNLLDEMCNAFDDEWDLGTTTTDQMRAALRVLVAQMDTNDCRAMAEMLVRLSEAK